ncbi:MAG: Chorismate mutase [Parcubacteria group bacterium GW2011_GWA2_49_9]|nr:MAG: Chorismate mutase [Parcubacteria group bacterium GW2011_GWA2_49_9]
MTTDKLHNLRKTIDELDAEVLRALAERFMHVQAVREVKKSAGLPPLDEVRWQEVIKSRLALAKELGLPEEFTKKLLALIHERSLEIEA